MKPETKTAAQPRPIHNGPPVVQILPDTKGKNRLQRFWTWLTGAIQWETTEVYYLYVEYLKAWVMIPPLFIFDGASIPKLFHALVRPEGFLFVPGLLHDHAYRYAMIWVAKNRTGPFRQLPLNRQQSDRLFREVGQQLTGLDLVKAAWSTLRLFGWRAWNRHRKREKQEQEHNEQL